MAALVFCALMLCVHIKAATNSQGLADFWRDMYWATAIAHGEAWPSAGPQINQMIELGPWWFYLLALPIRLGGNAVAVMVLIQALAALKYVLAWYLGERIAGPRFGFACAVSLAISGWSTAGILFPTHVALVETTLLLLALATWRCASALTVANAILLGLASAACLHAHPTTASWVAAAVIFLIWRWRSTKVLLVVGMSTAIVLLSLLPPWLDRSAAVAAALKPVSGYLHDDVGVTPLLRVSHVLRGIVIGGAWWGWLLMTQATTALARVAWGLYCACLLFAACGVALLRGESRRLRALFFLALAGFVLQVVFLVLLRPITPVWMVPSCLPPLALAIAIGWYGWLQSDKRVARTTGAIAIAIYVVLILAPFSMLLRDIRSARQMPGVNPFLNAGDQSGNYVRVPVPFYPLRRIDRLSESLCVPMVLHGRLAAAIEPTFGATIRNACGHWPAIRYGGVTGSGIHVAGLLAGAAATSGIAPEQVISRMAIYRSVRPIAPQIGGGDMQPRRLQITPDSAPAASRSQVFDFDAEGADAIVLTNRLPMAAPMNVKTITASARPAPASYDDGGSTVYRCDRCEAAASVHWHVELEGIAGNLDLVVLSHRPSNESNKQIAAVHAHPESDSRQQRSQ